MESFDRKGIFFWVLIFLIGTGCNLKTEEELKQEKKDKIELQEYKDEVKKISQKYLDERKANIEKAKQRVAEIRAEEKRKRDLQVAKKRAQIDQYWKDEAIRVAHTKKLRSKQQEEDQKIKNNSSIDLEATDDFKWETDYTVALNKAKEQGKTGIMLYLRQESSSPCRKLEIETLRNKYLIKLTTENFVPLKVNIDKPEELAPVRKFFPEKFEPPLIVFLSRFEIRSKSSLLFGVQSIPQMVRTIENNLQIVEELNTQYSYLMRKLENTPEDPTAILRFANVLFDCELYLQAAPHYIKGTSLLKDSYDHEKDYVNAIYCLLRCKKLVELEEVLSIFQENYVDSSHHTQIYYAVGQVFLPESPEMARKYLKLGLKYPDPTGEWHSKITQTLNLIK